MKYLIFPFLCMGLHACNSQNHDAHHSINNPSILQAPEEIGEYVTSVYEDLRGNLWFGTLQKGIAMYDGKQFRYYTSEDGLPSDRVTSILEDADGNYWLTTGDGLSKYDGSSFTNYRIGENDVASNMISQVYIDRDGAMWIGTWGGIYKFDGKDFAAFSLPAPAISTVINEDTKNWITVIQQDNEGNMWFARDGHGICSYDGESFKHYLKRDGLHSNNITEIEFANDGAIWFGTRVAERDHPNPAKRFGKGGINRLVDGEFLSFPEIEAFSIGDVYCIYEAPNRDIWISTTQDGIYQYDGSAFSHYDVPGSVMDMTYDRNGILWLAAAGGLYQLNKDGAVLHVTTEGPWE